MATLSGTVPSTVYQHSQSVPSAVWIIKHNLARYPVVDIYVDFEGAKHRILPQDVVYTDANTCTIQFSQPFTGVAAVS